MAVVIDVDKCSGCGRCVRECPVSAISIDTLSQKAVIDSGLCVQCGACISFCRIGAISEAGSTLHNTGIFPKGPGQSSGSGRGIGSGRGGGSGRGIGSGGNIADMCFCPLCGRVFPHKVGVPCAGIMCPDCGTSLVRK